MKARILIVEDEPGIRLALSGRRGVAVLDQNLSVGAGGITVGEIAHALYADPARPPLLSYVGGLGGKEIGEQEFEKIIEDLRVAAASGQTPPPRLLFTEAEAAQMETLLAIAGKRVAAAEAAP